MRVFVMVVSCALCCACSDSPDKPPAPDGGRPLDAATDAAGELPEPEAAVPDAAAPEICDVIAPTVCPDPMPRYDDVSPIFAARCTSCHNGSDGMWPLSTYQHVADWYGEIRAAMLTCTMPPLDSGQTMPLAERRQILDWIRCGFPR